MADVVLLLVIFFMTTSSFVQVERGLPIDLPGSATAVPTPSAIEVSLATDGTLALDGVSVAGLSELEAGLREALAARPGAVALRADRSAPHGRVVEVMDVIRRAGATRLGISTREP
jgi:biopolymer transport protein ExbD